MKQTAQSGLLCSLRDRIKQDFFFFAYSIMQNKDLSKIHYKVCKEIEKMPTRLLVVLPRGFFKSSLLSVAYPLWLACINPNIRILLVAKSKDNASRRIRLIKSKIENDKLLVSLFPHLLPQNLKEVRWNETALQVQRSCAELESTFECAGVGTALPSRHYDVIICDDIVTADSDDMTEDNILPSPAEIAKAIGFHRLLPTLLVPPVEKKQIIHVATRWDKKDVIQYILDNEKDEYSSIITGVLENGKPVFPEMFPMEVIDKLRKSLGSYIFSLQYDNVALSNDDYMVKAGQLQIIEKYPEDITYGIVVDPAISKKKSAADCVILVGGAFIRDGMTHYVIIDYIARKGLSPIDVCRYIFKFYKYYRNKGLVRVGIEINAYQESLVYYLKGEMDKEECWFPVNEINSRKDKVSRIYRLQPYIENNRFLIKKGLDTLIKQLYDFPASKGASYDILDCCSFLLDVIDIIKPIKSKNIDNLSNNYKITYENIISSLNELHKSRLPFAFLR